MMKKKNSEDDGCCLHSWWLDSIHNRPSQSQWLHSTLSDLEEKVKEILTLIEDDGDTFAERAEMFYKKKPQLLQSVQDLHQSYRSLAEKYNQLVAKSESAQTSSNRLSAEKHNQLAARAESIVNCPNLDSEFEGLASPQNQSQSQSQIVESKTNGVDFDDDLKKGLLEKEKRWDELRKNLSNLIDDNLKKQAELVRRNDEKREAIKELEARVGQLSLENGDMRTRLAQKQADLKRNRSQISKAKNAIWKKLQFLP